MRKIAILLGAALLPGLAFAQTASNQIGTAAQSGSFSGVTNNFAQSPSDQTLRTAPAISAPTLYTMSTCGTPISGGVTVVGFGAAAGTVVYSDSCKHEQESVVYVPLLGKLGHADIAMALLCESADVRAAALAAHDPCPKVAVQTPKVVQAAQAPAPAKPMPAAVLEDKPKTCHQVFVEPADPNGAGYMQQVCN